MPAMWGSLLVLLLLILIGFQLLMLHMWHRGSCVDENSGVLKHTPIIFASGPQSSGTGLLRILLDAHPMINCGAEPIFTLPILRMTSSLSPAGKERALKAHLIPEALDLATAAFIRELTINMVPPAPIVCQKQPMIFEHLDRLSTLFPEDMFVLIIRDARAAVLSTIKRGIDRRYNANTILTAMKDWETSVRKMVTNCHFVSKQRCYLIRYEKLVMNPEIELRKLMTFLRVPWDPILLKHETILDKLSYLNPLEASTKQFVKKIHTESLSKWATHKLTGEILNASVHAPLLVELGYTAVGFPPDYSKLLDEVMIDH